MCEPQEVMTQHGGDVHRPMIDQTPDGFWPHPKL